MERDELAKQKLRVKVDLLTKERDRFKRIAENLLIEYNQILEDEYARGPNKLEDFNEDFEGDK